MAQLFRCGGSVAGIPIGEKWEYAYTGSVQEWTAPATAVYKFTLRGGKGGHDLGKQGGTTIYYRKVTKGQVIYVMVGGNGTSAYHNQIGGSVALASGYNVAKTSNYTAGWWSANTWGSGGGATHIALKAGTLDLFTDDTEPILAVAGGGGGGFTHVNTLDNSNTGSSEGRPGNDTAVTTGVLGHSAVAGSAAHGSGWISMNTAASTGYGGAGYVKEESIIYKGVTYMNSIVTGEAGTAGSATIECIA